MADSGNKKRLVTLVVLLIVIVLGALWLAGNVMQDSRESREKAKTQAGQPQPVVVKNKLPSPAGSPANPAEAAKPAVVRNQLPTPPAAEPPSSVTPAPEPPKAVEAPLPVREEKPAETAPVPSAASPPSAPPSPSVAEAPPAAPPPPSQPEPAKPLERARTEGGVAPFSILLSSCRDRQNAVAELPAFRQAGLAPYIVQTDLGAKGTWWRILTGYFKSPKEASQAKKVLNLTDAVVVKTPFADLVGVYPSEAGAAEMTARLGKLGHFPYAVKGPKTSIQLMVGAFLAKSAAEKLQRELAAQGIASRVVQR
jgi:outer membrane biosynthesis protein TonB